MPKKLTPRALSLPKCAAVCAIWGVVFVCFSGICCFVFAQQNKHKNNINKQIANNLLGRSGLLWKMCYFCRRIKTEDYGNPY